MYLDRRLWAFTAGVRGRIALAVLVGLLAAAVGVARLALLGWLIGRLFAGAALESLLLPIAAIAAVMILRGILEYARTMLAHETAARVQRALRARLYDQIVALGPSYFGLNRSGEVASTVIDGVEQLEVYFGQYLPQLAVAALTPIGIFAFIAVLDPVLAAVMLAFALFTLVAPAMFHRQDRAAALARGRDYAAFAAELLDSLQGLATLKAFGQSRARGDLLAERAHALFRSTMWVLATNALARGITDSGIAIGVAVTLAIGAWRVVDGASELSSLLIVLMVGIEVFRPLRDLRTYLHTGMLGQAAAGKIEALLAALPAIEDRGTLAGPVAPAPGLPVLRFDDIGFAYPGAAQTTLDGLSLDLPAGARIGVVGESGAGKSTLQRLLQRFFEPQSGTILLNGRPLADYSLAALRGHFAVVSQDTYLFHGSVADNLRLAKPDARAEDLERAARAANAHGFIARLPQGYDTIIGERGIRLSGGQRQRVAIARALLRDAPILILDEALSAVDAENELVIQRALDVLMRDRTTLIFAHRLSSIIDCDAIAVLDDGRIVEQGSHAELLARGGRYADLMALQAAAGGPGGLGGPDARSAAHAPLATDSLADHDPDNWLPLPDEQPRDEILRAEGLGWWGASRALMAHIAPWKSRLAGTFVFGVLRVLALIAVGALGGLTVAALKSGAPFGPYLWGLALAAPLAGLLHWLESWLAHDMAFRMLAEMRIALFRKLDSLAPAYLLRRRSGDLVAMATQDVETVEYFFAHTVAPAFVAVLVPLAVLAILGGLAWPMALALAPFLVFVALSPFFARKRVDALGSRGREALAELNAVAVDTIQGLAEIASFQAEAARRAALLARIDRHHGIRLPFFRDLTLQMAGLEIATGLGGLAVILAGAVSARAGLIEVGLLPFAALIAMSAFLPVSEIAAVGRQLADTLGATRRLEAVHADRPVVADAPGADPIPPAAPIGMALEHVEFRYGPNLAPALADTGFTIPAGATTALVGPSGAGKTTAAALLMRFFDPQQGQVRLNDRDVREFELEALRGSIAMVSQDTYLFNDTLAANILIARPDAGRAALDAAIARAALGDLVRRLPEGLDTPVGERGLRLSGGQRQRVAIARAFLKDAPVLILDEATSHLDAINEIKVRAALQALSQGRTTIVIAHRLSSVRDAAQIVVLDGGAAVESGSHDALMRAGGAYAHLVSRQLAASAQQAAQ